MLDYLMLSGTGIRACDFGAFVYAYAQLPAILQYVNLANFGDGADQSFQQQRSGRLKGVRPLVSGMLLKQISANCRPGCENRP